MLSFQYNMQDDFIVVLTDDEKKKLGLDKYESFHK